MKRLIILTVALMMLFSASLMATETRVLTMGDNNMVLLDDANIFMFPSRVNEYPNLAVGEFSQGFIGSGDFNKFGIHWKFGDDNPWVWATYFSTSTNAGPTNLTGDPIVSWNSFGGLPQNHRIQSIYGRELGGYKFGFGLDWLRSGEKDDFADNQANESFGSFDISLGLTEVTGQWDVVLNVLFGGWTDEDDAGLKETESDGYMDFGLAGRYFKSGPNYTWIPHAGFMYQKRGIKDNDQALDGDLSTLDLTTKDTKMSVELGIGLNWEPAANVLAVADFGISYEKTKRTWDTTATTLNASTFDDEKTWTTTTLPFWKIGMDADVFKWMDIRFGATSDWDNMVTETKVSGTGTKKTTTSATSATYLGFGFHWGRLHIDTQTDPDLFLDGFNFISGGKNDMNWRISAVYEMM